jgi:hypothetical protein
MPFIQFGQVTLNLKYLDQFALFSNGMTHRGFLETEPEHPIAVPNVGMLLLLRATWFAEK